MSRFTNTMVYHSPSSLIRLKSFLVICVKSCSVWPMITWARAQYTIHKQTDKRDVWISAWKPFCDVSFMPAQLSGISGFRLHGFCMIPLHTPLHVSIHSKLCMVVAPVSLALQKVPASRPQTWLLGCTIYNWCDLIKQHLEHAKLRMKKKRTKAVLSAPSV